MSGFIAILTRGMVEDGCHPRQMLVDGPLPETDFGRRQRCGTGKAGLEPAGALLAGSASAVGQVSTQLGKGADMGLLEVFDHDAGSAGVIEQTDCGSHLLDRVGVPVTGLLVLGDRFLAGFNQIFLRTDR